MEDKAQAKLAEIEQRAKSNTHRMDKLEARMDENEKLVTAVCGLQKDMDYTKKTVEKLDVKLDAVVSRPGKLWLALVKGFLTALVGGLAAYVLFRLGLGG